MMEESARKRAGQFMMKMTSLILNSNADGCLETTLAFQRDERDDMKGMAAKVAGQIPYQNADKIARKIRDLK